MNEKLDVLFRDVRRIKISSRRRLVCATLGQISRNFLHFYSTCFDCVLQGVRRKKKSVMCFNGRITEDVEGNSTAEKRTMAFFLMAG